MVFRKVETTKVLIIRKVENHKQANPFKTDIF